MKRFIPQLTFINHFLLSLLIGVFLFIPTQSVHSYEKVKFVQEIKDGFLKPIDVAKSQDGLIYILDKEAAKVFVFNKEGERINEIGAKGSRQGELYQPNALAVSLNGDLIVADTGNSRVVVFDPNGNYLFELGHAGHLPGEFIMPNSLAVDQLGYIFVADASKKTISKFTPRGVFLEVLPLSFKPQKISFDVQQNLYVLMPEAPYILKMGLDGHNVKISYQNNSINYLSYTSSMAVDHRGDIYLMERYDHSVKKIAADQQLLFSFGSQGEGRGQFNQAKSITVDEDGYVYIADTNNKRVQVLSISGSEKPALTAVEHKAPMLDYQRSIPSEQTIIDLQVVKDRGMYALSDYYGHIFHKEHGQSFQKSEESFPIALNSPKALYVNTQGQMLVADTGDHRLKFLKPDGTFDYQFGRKGKRNGEFNALEGVAISQKGFIYVADTFNHRIQIFNSDGIYLNAFGQRSKVSYKNAPAQGSFNMPKDLVFDSTDHLYVLDAKNKRIQVFDTEGAFIKEIGGINDVIRFMDPVDIAIDEKDNLYVADKGAHQVHILNREGAKILTFGSSGKGPGYFPNLSSIAALDGKVYVADYDVDQIQIFQFDPQGIKVEEPKMVVRDRSAISFPSSEQRLVITQVSYPLYFDTSNQEKYTKAREVTLSLAVRKLAKKLNVTEEVLTDYIQIDAEEMLPSRQMKLTVSAPQSISMPNQETHLSKHINSN